MQNIGILWTLNLLKGYDKSIHHEGGTGVRGICCDSRCSNDCVGFKTMG